MNTVRQVEVIHGIGPAKRAATQFHVFNGDNECVGQYRTQAEADDYAVWSNDREAEFADRTQEDWDQNVAG